MSRCDNLPIPPFESSYPKQELELSLQYNKDLKILNSKVISSLVAPELTNAIVVAIYEIRLFASGWSPLQGTETRKFASFQPFIHGPGLNDPTSRRLRVDELLEPQDDGSKICWIEKDIREFLRNPLNTQAKPLNCSGERAAGNSLPVQSAARDVVPSYHRSSFTVKCSRMLVLRLVECTS